MLMPDVGAVSARTKKAVQDYTALNTIATAVERMNAKTHTEFDLHLIAALGDAGDERLRVKLNCPIGRRLLALGLVTRSTQGRGRVRRAPR